MHSIDIYRSGSLFVTIKPDDSSDQSSQIMGENVIHLRFALSNYMPFAVNDYCTVFGEKYTLKSPVTVVKESAFSFTYSMTMQSESMNLADAQFLFLGPSNDLTESDFSIIGTADTFVDLIVKNINRISSGWVKGQVIQTDYKNLSFSKDNCYNALSKLASEFSTEFWIEGKTVHLTRRRKDTNYTFKHGRHKGLYEVSRQPLDNSSIITRLYAFGSDKNLPGDYRNYSRRLKMFAGADYVEQYTQIFGVIEHTEIFDDVYPTRNGTVTSIDAGNFYRFFDSGIDFDIKDQLLPGASPKVVFNTGQLAGYQFEIKSFNYSTKEFIILKNKDERSIEVPSTLLKPAIGDNYVLIDLQMPQSYINAAEQELTNRATQTLARISVPQYTYGVVIDPAYIKRKGWTPEIGNEVYLIDNDLQVNRKIRISHVVRKIVNENDYTVQLSDAVTPGTIATIISNQQATSTAVTNLGYQVQNNSIFNGIVIGDLKIKQGALIVEIMPETSTVTSMLPVYYDPTTKKLYAKV